MSEHLLQAFISLVTFDKQVYALLEERNSLYIRLGEIEEQKQFVIQQLDDLKFSIHSLKKEVDEKELSMQVLEQQESEKRKRLAITNSPKEYMSVKAEIQVVAQAQHDQEEGLIEAWERFDAAQKKYTVESVHCQKKIEELTCVHEEIERKIASLSSLIDQNEKTRKDYLQYVPVELLRNYEHMRGLVHDPVVPVLHNSCGACFYSVPLQDLAVLKKGRLLPCKSCYRILYVQE